MVNGVDGATLVEEIRRRASAEQITEGEAEALWVTNGQGKRIRGVETQFTVIPER